MALLILTILPILLKNSLFASLRLCVSALNRHFKLVFLTRRAVTPTHVAQYVRGPLAGRGHRHLLWEGWRRG